MADDRSNDAAVAGAMVRLLACQAHADRACEWADWLREHPGVTLEPQHLLELTVVCKPDVVRVAACAAALDRLIRPITTRELYALLVEGFDTARYTAMFVLALEPHHVARDARFPPRRLAAVCYPGPWRAAIAAHLAAALPRAPPPKPTGPPL